ncbi:MAG: thrombospondin type 3 repeat-containing protein [Myxococcota bacterium]
MLISRRWKPSGGPLPVRSLAALCWLAACGGLVLAAGSALAQTRAATTFLSDAWLGSAAAGSPIFDLYPWIQAGGGVEAYNRKHGNVVVHWGRFDGGMTSRIPWKVFLEDCAGADCTYQQFRDKLASYPDPALADDYAAWLAAVDDRLARLPEDVDPVTRPLYVYENFIYGTEAGLGYNVPMPGFSGTCRCIQDQCPEDPTWPDEFLMDTDPAERTIFGYMYKAFPHANEASRCVDGAGTTKRPSFRGPAIYKAYRNLTRFLIQHFNPYAFSPYREINGATGFQMENPALGDWTALVGNVYRAVVDAAKTERGTSLPVFATLELEWATCGPADDCSGIGQGNALARHIEGAKQLYLENLRAGVPFDIGLSTYPPFDDWTIDHLLGGELVTFARYAEALASASDVVDRADSDGDGNTTEAISIAVGPVAGHPIRLFLSETAWPAWNGPATQRHGNQAYRRGLVTAADLDGPIVRNFHELDQLAYFRWVVDLPTLPAPQGVPFPVELIGNIWSVDGSVPMVLSSERRSNGQWSHTISGLNRSWSFGGRPKLSGLYIDTLSGAGDYDGDAIASLALTNDPEGAVYPFQVDLPDNCPYTTNPSQEDGDGDGVGDACDNCIAVSNAYQEDWDADGIGNACDADLDNDGQIDQADLDAVVMCRSPGATIPVLDALFAAVRPRWNDPHCFAQPAPGGGTAYRINFVPDLDGDDRVTTHDGHGDLEAVRTRLGTSQEGLSGLSCANDDTNGDGIPGPCPQFGETF